ncbi:MAG: hypothetical protein J0L80_07935 [Chitinophagales bacterium]|nr:hypothetical protein [Chitinophagales bacterium]
MKKLVSVLLTILSVAVGALFIYSAYTKLYTIQSFESFQYSIVEYVKLPWLVAAIGGRYLIGVEMGLGILLITHLWGKNKWAPKAAAILTIIFSIYLVYLWIYAGDDINCGCFGDAIWMSPSASLIKNAGLLIALQIITRYHNGFRNAKLAWTGAAIAIACSIVPFILYPLPDTHPQWLQKGRFQLDMTKLYEPGKTDTPTVDLRKGKHVIAFFSLKCPHCQIAAYKMHIMKANNPSLPFQMVIAGKDENKAEFFKKTKAENIPYTKLKGEDFTNLVGFSWPVIYLVKDGWVEAQTDYVTMSQGAIEDWLAKP